MFSIVYFTMRPLSTVDDNLKRDEKLNNLISSLKCKGPACFKLHSFKDQNSLRKSVPLKNRPDVTDRDSRSRIWTPDISALKLVITNKPPKGKGSAIQNFIEHRIRPFGIDI